jgi:hypothetical protein
LSDISLRQLADSLLVNKTAGNIVQRVGFHWPPPPVVSIREVVRCTQQTPWTNAPQTQSMTPQLTCNATCVEDIVAAVQIAERNGGHVHAVGSAWSFSDCAMGLNPANMCLVETSGLNNPIQTVQKALLGGLDSALFYHVQAGITIHDLYTNLDNFVDPVANQPRPLGLLTMGGASGQTLAGAFSTGTHGGDYLMPPLADSILAIHLVGAGGVQYWIEPTHGITDPNRLQMLVVPNISPQNIIYDDATFNACLVSFGCMGVIYAVVVKVRDQYNLVETSTLTTWQAFVSTLPAPLTDQSARFLQLAVDPYTKSDGTNTCLVTTRTEGGAPACTCAQGDVNGAIISLLEDMITSDPIDALKVGVQGVIDLINGGGAFNTMNTTLVTLVNAILSQAMGLRSVLTNDYGNVMTAVWPPGTCGGKSYCVMDTGQRGSATNKPPTPPPAPSFSIEMFFPSTGQTPTGFPWVDFVNSIVTAVNAATDTFLTGYVGIRFMGQTRAMLGMQQSGQTCSIEISTLGGVQGELALLTSILDMALQAGANVHWGQLIDLDIQGNGNRYPQFQAWRQVYARLSNNFTTRTFENALSTRWQLTTP